MEAALPGGFRYVADFVPEADVPALLDAIGGVTLGDVVMRGQVARRRVAHFGWRYGYESWQVEPGPPIPDTLLPLRERAAALISVTPEALAEVLVTAYPPGAGIGWHRDAPVFGVVVGVSLGAACRFRLQRGRGEARQTRAVVLEPRSAYVLDGAARWAWQHSIPPLKTARYSITFRTLRAPQPAHSQGSARTGRRSASPR